MNWIQKGDKLVIEGFDDVAIQLEDGVHKLWQGASELLGEFDSEDSAKAAGEEVVDNRVNPKPVEPVVEESAIEPAPKSKKAKDAE